VRQPPAAAAASDAAWLAGLTPAHLPRPSSIVKAVNGMPKDTQDSLRKRCYDYSRANGVLKSMGVKVPAARGGAQQARKGQAAGGPARQPAAVGGGQRADAAPAEPAAKRQRSDAVQGAAAAAPEVGHAVIGGRGGGSCGPGHLGAGWGWGSQRDVGMRREVWQGR
jgi:hypothetical protein